MVKNIVLIGMPGTGKTTVGQEISKMTGLKFVDTDDLLKARCQMVLKNFVAEKGTEAFFELQRRVICEINYENLVIATGGGVVMDNDTMTHLRKIGDIVYLNTPIDVLEKRLDPNRRLARNVGESFRDVFNKRQPLYEKYSDSIIDCRGKDVSQVTKEIYEIIKARSKKQC